MNETLLEVRNLQLHFPQRSGVFLQHRRYVRAVDGVSLDIRAGETLGLVGESGCGKSSLGKALLNLYRPTAGEIRYRGRNIAGLGDRPMRPLRRQLQIIFQDPFESLNARQPVANILEEPLLIHGIGDASQRRQRVRELLELVGLPPQAANKYPHEFSGGQRQRIGIARAIALEPELIVCDEAVSALDVSVQAQILNLLLEIQQRMGLTLLFISHDLSVVRHMADRICVMYLGQLVEIGDADTLYQRPAHPYTQALLAAVPQIGGDRELPAQPLAGDIPSPLAPPPGCRFHTRCPHADAQCRSSEPAMEVIASDSGRAQQVACHHWRKLR